MNKPKVRGITIDSAHSKDLDDALWIEHSGDGEDLKVFVSIADVAAVVDFNSQYFKNAAEQSETIYLRDRNIPMLPRELSEDLLSLLPFKERNCLTVEICIKPGQKITFEFYESVLISECKMSYEVADRTILLPDEPYHHQLKALKEVASALNKARAAEGAIGGVWFSDDLMFTEEGVLERVFHSQMIVAEFMILTNTLVAQWLCDKQVKAIFRNHKARDTAFSQDAMLQAMLSLGDALAIRRQMGRWLDKAEYGIQATGHYALNVDAYCHFTSPIRRCADLICHQIIKSILQDQESLYRDGELKFFAEHFTNKKKERKDMFRAKQQATREQHITADLSKFSSKDFSKVLQNAIKNGRAGEISAEILNRLTSDRLTPKDLYYLAFQGENELQQKVITYLSGKTDKSTSLLAIADQVSETWKFLNYVIESQCTNFVAWVEFTNTKENKVYTARPCCSPSKQIARHQASLAWVKAFLTHQLIEPSEAKIVFASDLVKTDVKAETPGVAPAKVVEVDLSALPEGIENYIGELNECCQSLRWKLPTYKFEQSGSPHEPIFLCEAALIFGEEQVLKKKASGTNKKASQQQAAGAILNALVVQQVIEF